MKKKELRMEEEWKEWLYRGRWKKGKEEKGRDRNGGRKEERKKEYKASGGRGRK